MAAHRRLGKEEVVSRFREALQTSYAAKGFQVSEINLGWYLSHFGQNITPLSFQMQVKIDFLKENSIVTIVSAEKCEIVLLFFESEDKKIREKLGELI